MKPFDLDEALNGKEVCTRSGRKVLGLHYFQDLKIKQKLIVLIKGENGYHETESYSEDGQYLFTETESDYDLMMVDDEVEKEKVTGLTFGEAIEVLKNGGKVHHNCMCPSYYVYLIPESETKEMQLMFMSENTKESQYIPSVTDMFLARWNVVK